MRKDPKLYASSSHHHRRSSHGERASDRHRICRRRRARDRDSNWGLANGRVLNVCGLCRGTCNRMPWGGETLCGCFDDCCTCCSVLWCSCVTVPQLYTRVIGKGYFVCIFSVLLMLLVASYGLETLSEAFVVGAVTTGSLLDDLDIARVLSPIGDVTCLIYLIIIVFILVQVRRKLRESQK